MASPKAKVPEKDSDSFSGGLILGFMLTLLLGLSWLYWYSEGSADGRKYASDWYSRCSQTLDVLECESIFTKYNFED